MMIHGPGLDRGADTMARVGQRYRAEPAADAWTRLLAFLDQRLR